MDFPVTDAFALSASPAQLHAEARGTATTWPASFSFVGGKWVYRVDLADLADADRDRVTAAIAAHVPNADFGLDADALSWRALAAKPTLTATEVAAAVRLLLRRR